MSEKISIPIGLDASGVSADIQKASANVGKATVGMARGISAAVGQSLGPFGELIEKADAFKQALGGITTGSKLMAGAIGIAGVAAVYSVTKAVEAYKEMREAINEAKKAQDRLTESNKQFAKSILEKGIVPGTEEKTLRQLETARQENRFTGQTDADRKAMREAEDFIISGEAGRLGARLAFEKNLSPELKSALKEEELLNRYGGKSVGELQKIEDQASSERDRGLLMGGGEGAIIASEAQKVINEVRPFIEAIGRATQEAEKLEREMMERTRAEEEGVRGGYNPYNTIRTAAPMGPVPTAYTMPQGYGVGGYTSTGGGGNIYGNTAGMGERIRSMAEDVRRIADNTDRAIDVQTTNLEGL